jgi:hypothetical protein
VLVGDVILAVNGTVVRSPHDLTAALGGLHEGTSVTLSLMARGDRVLVATARPVERYDDLVVRLGVATHGAIRLRTIAVTPRGEGPFATVLFLQGYSCGTIERPASTVARDALRHLVASFAKHGFAVWRVEKRGVGDSEGPTAAEASFDDERDDFAAALRAVLSDPQTDRACVAVLGHSLGALHAPTIAAEGATALVLYGAGSRTWLEYIADNTRRQCALQHLDAAQTEQLVRLRQRFFYAVLLERRSVREVFERDPSLARHRYALGVDDADRIDERRELYWRGVEGAEIARPLREAALPTLALWGSADWLSARVEHEELAAMVNEVAPGRGSLVTIEGADHGFFAHTDAHASWSARWTGAPHDGIAATVVSWLRR